MLSNRAKALSPSITLGISARQNHESGIPVINLSIGEPDFVTPIVPKPAEPMPSKTPSMMPPRAISVCVRRSAAN